MAQCFLLKRNMLVWTIGIYSVLYLLLVLSAATFKFCAISQVAGSSLFSGRQCAIAGLLNTLSFFLAQLTYLTLMFKLPTSTHCTQTYAEHANLRKNTRNGIFERNHNRLQLIHQSICQMPLPRSSSFLGFERLPNVWSLLPQTVCSQAVP